MQQDPGWRPDHPVYYLTFLHEQDRRCRPDVVSGSNSRVILDVDFSHRVPIGAAVGDLGQDGGKGVAAVGPAVAKENHRQAWHRVLLPPSTSMPRPPNQDVTET